MDTMFDDGMSPEDFHKEEPTVEQVNHLRSIISQREVQLDKYVQLAKNLEAIAKRNETELSSLKQEQVAIRQAFKVEFDTPIAEDEDVLDLVETFVVHHKQKEQQLSALKIKNAELMIAGQRLCDNAKTLVTNKNDETNKHLWCNLCNALNAWSMLIQHQVLSTALSPDTTPSTHLCFSDGITSEASSCLCLLDLIEQKKWSFERAKKHLQAVINSPPRSDIYVRKEELVKARIEELESVINLILTREHHGGISDWDDTNSNTINLVVSRLRRRIEQLKK